MEDQQLWVDADRFTPYDDKKCVTGEYLPVAGTPLDFRMPHTIGERIDADYPQLKVVNGYDHTWELNTKGDDTRPAAWVYDPTSGRKMEIFTTEPGIQIYTGNGLKGKMTGKRGIAYPFRSAVCFETMHFQDSPNQPEFPSTVLRPERFFIVIRFISLNNLLICQFADVLIRGAIYAHTVIGILAN